MSGADERPWQVKAQLVEPLSKRELFAAMAMQGFLARNRDGHASDFASGSVLMADALLAELDRLP